MSEEEAVTMARGIVRDRKELAGTILRVSPANSLAHGSAGNLTRLAINVGIMGLMLRANGTDWYKFCIKHNIQDEDSEDSEDHVLPGGHQFGNTDGGH